MIKVDYSEDTTMTDAQIALAIPIIAVGGMLILTALIIAYYENDSRKVIRDYILSPGHSTDFSPNLISKHVNSKGATGCRNKIVIPI